MRVLKEDNVIGLNSISGSNNTQNIVDNSTTNVSNTTTTNNTTNNDNSTHNTTTNNYTIKSDIDEQTKRNIDILVDIITNEKNPLHSTVEYLLTGKNGQPIINKTPPPIIRNTIFAKDKQEIIISKKVGTSTLIFKTGATLVWINFLNSDESAIRSWIGNTFNRIDITITDRVNRGTISKNTGTDLSYSSKSNLITNIIAGIKNLHNSISGTKDVDNLYTEINTYIDSIADVWWITDKTTKQVKPNSDLFSVGPNAKNNQPSTSYFNNNFDAKELLKTEAFTDNSGATRLALYDRAGSLQRAIKFDKSVTPNWSIGSLAGQNVDKSTWVNNLKQINDNWRKSQSAVAALTAMHLFLKTILDHSNEINKQIGGKAALNNQTFADVNNVQERFRKALTLSNGGARKILCDFLRDQCGLLQAAYNLRTKNKRSQ